MNDVNAKLSSGRAEKEEGQLVESPRHRALRRVLQEASALRFRIQAQEDLLPQPTRGAGESSTGPETGGSLLLPDLGACLGEILEWPHTRTGPQQP